MDLRIRIRKTYFRTHNAGMLIKKVSTGKQYDAANPDLPATGIYLHGFQFYDNLDPD
jgi:hypothetical protein